MSSYSRAHRLFVALLAISIASLAAALLLGSVSLPPSTLLQAMEGDSPRLAYTLVVELRLPRALLAYAVGGLLALAGTLMQALLRNPLADPYILGTSGGAAVGALGALWLELQGIWVRLAAFTGALLSTLLVFTLARGGTSALHPTRLLLTGVVLGAGWGAAISFILTISPLERVHGMLFWLMGDLGQPNELWPTWFTLVGGLGAALATGRTLNILSLGELQASALGVPVAWTRVLVFLLASLVTAIAVTAAGAIGFVGLIAPHLLRLLGVRDHRWLLPCAPLLGGSLLVWADTLSRFLIAPQQLPVGVITAFLGVPWFLYLLHRHDPH